jgi:hypothetical protein
LVTTNTVAEGDTRETGLAVIVGMGGRIYYADRYVKWGGDAVVEVNLVAIRKLSGNDSCPVTNACLDAHAVPYISSYLDDLPDQIALVLDQNRNKGFIGELIRGIGFVMSHEEARELVSRDRSYQDCLRPYLNGQDINGDPEQRPGRIVICFETWPLEKAKEYPELLKIAETRVKPERMRLPPITSDYRKLREKWWQFARFGLEMRKAVSDLHRVLIRSRVSEQHMVVFVPKGTVYSDATVVFAYDDHFHFALLQSWVHEVWLRRQASSLRTDVRYTPTDCFQTFPFPQQVSEGQRERGETQGRLYYEHRQGIMRARQVGLTKTYNLFHDPACTDPDIAEMRHLHAEMDQAVLACYGWQDIDLAHGFYLNDRKKTRFMPSREAQREIFTRLLALNQEIAAQEAAAGILPTAEPSDDGDEAESDDE